jgi:hypothetical protein
MHVLLDCLDPLDVFRFLRKEWIEHRLVIAGRIKPPLDANLLHQVVKPKRRADHPDRSDDRELVTDDLVGRAGQHVSPRRTDILDEG